MKTKALIIVALAFGAAPAANADDIVDEKIWSANYPVSTSAPRLKVSNIWGSVAVTAGPPGEISLRVEERRLAPTQALFDRSLEVLTLEVEADQESVSMVVGDRDRWHRADNCEKCRVDYQLELQVPPGSTIDVATVMDGKVTVSGISGQVSARNVNGPVAVDSVRECVEVGSVNGRVDLSFSGVPSDDCRIETINGDITLVLPASAGLDVSLDLFNGRIVTEFDVDPLSLPAEVDEVEEDGRYRYKIVQPAGVRLGGGGPLFTFSSINGDVRINSNQ